VSSECGCGCTCEYSGTYGSKHGNGEHPVYTLLVHLLGHVHGRPHGDVRGRGLAFRGSPGGSLHRRLCWRERGGRGLEHHVRRLRGVFECEPKTRGGTADARALLTWMLERARRLRVRWAIGLLMGMSLATVKAMATVA